MIVKNIQIYGVQISWKSICRSKEKKKERKKVDISTSSRQNSLLSPYQQLQAKAEKKILIPHSSLGRLWNVLL